MGVNRGVDTGLIISSQLHKEKLGVKRCAYPLCNKILYFTFRQDQTHCNTTCGSLDRKRIALLKSKEFTKLKQAAKQIFETWSDSDIPIYKLTALDQYRIKFHILNKSHLPSKTQQRKNKTAKDLRYRRKHKERYNNAMRVKRRLFEYLWFAKFWNRIENENI